MTNFQGSHFGRAISLVFNACSEIDDEAFQLLDRYDTVSNSNFEAKSNKYFQAGSPSLDGKLHMQLHVTFVVLSFKG